MVLSILPNSESRLMCQKWAKKQEEALTFPRKALRTGEKNLCSYILEIPKVWILLSINLTFFLNKKQSRLLSTQGYRNKNIIDRVCFQPRSDGEYRFYAKRVHFEDGLPCSLYIGALNRLS